MEAEGQSQIETVVLPIHLAAGQRHVDLVEAQRHDLDADCFESFAENRDRRDAQAHSVQILRLHDRALGGDKRTRAAIARDSENAHAGRLRALFVHFLEYGTVERVFRSALALEQVRQVGNIQRPAPFELARIADAEVRHVDRAELHACN